jgi:hypothetical protein
VNSDRSSEYRDKHHVSGELLNTEMDIVDAVLRDVFGSDHVRMKSHQDVLVDTEDLSLNIYFRGRSRHGGSNYLLGGNVYANYEYAAEVMYRMAHAFDRREVVYTLELGGSAHPNASVSHAKFKSLVNE